MSIRHFITLIENSMHEFPHDAHDVVQKAAKAFVEDYRVNDSSSVRLYVLNRLDCDDDHDDGQNGVTTQDFENELLEYALEQCDEAYDNIYYRVKNGVLAVWRVITAEENWTPGNQPLG